MSPNYLVVGAPGDAMMGENSGMIYIYELEMEGTTLDVDLDDSFMAGMNSVNARFGTAVSVYEGSSDVNVPENALSTWVLVGAPGLNTSGTVFIFYKESDESDWVQSFVFSPAVSVGAIGFGQSVAWYNDILVR